MKLNNQEPSILSQTSKSTVFYEGAGWAIGPNPATPEMIERAKFVDKTYVWRKK